jgi:ubiquinone/menaquinone biosynthesis C-methylase UbiE
MNNEAQIDYWNGAAGQKWVDQSTRLDAMLSPFADQVLEAVSLSSSERALDIGCGAGALTLRATEMSGGPVGALGVDVSEPLLRLARKRAADTGSKAVFEHADASTFSTATKFDAMISRFGVMFFEDPAAAFAKIRNQIRDGGRLTFMCWQALQMNDWAFAPLQAALPLLSEPPAQPEPHAPGPFAFADRDRVAALLTTAGWKNVSVEPFTTDIKLPGDDVETSAKFMLQLGPLSRLIAAQGLDSRLVEEAVMNRLENEVGPDGRVAMKSACWLVTALY